MKKLGLVGCGYWGPNIVRNLQKMRNADLEFVVDKDPSTIKKLPPVSFYDELDTALERHPEVEGVIIATPISTHFGLALRVLESGRHVLIQKPMAMTTEECDILEDVARSKDLQIMVAHTFLFTGAVKN